MADVVQLEPFDVATDEEELQRRALRRLQGLALPPAPSTPTQADVDAQAAGDAYRAMPDAQADAVESRMRRGTAGEPIYAAGDVPPPEAQRQRMMDRREARASAATAGQMAAMDAPTDRQRPSWMSDVASPTAEPSTEAPAATPQHRVEEIPLAELLNAPSSKTSEPAGGAASPPQAAQPPAGRDHTGADWFDAIFAPFQLIGAGLAAAGGRHMPMVSLGALERRQDLEDQLRQEERANAARMEKTRSAEQQARLQSREEAAALRREGMDRQDARAQAQMRQRAELAAQDPRRLAFQRESDRLAQLQDRGSPATIALREQVRIQRDLLPQQVRGQLGLSDERLAEMTGEQLERISGSLPRPSVGIRGSGGSGSAPRATPENTQALREAGRRLGLSDAVIESELGSPRGRQRLTDAMREEELRRSRDGAGSAPAAPAEDDALYQEAIRQGFPPVSAREMIADPDERARLRRQLGSAGIAERRADEAAGNDRDVSIAAAQDAVRALREALPPQGEDIPGIGVIDSIRGGGLMQSPEGRRIRTLAANAVRRYLRLESGAAISDQEMQQEMELRGLGPGATEQQFRDGLAQLERDLAVRAQRRERGSGSQQSAARPQSAQQPQRPASRAASDEVEVITSSGRRVAIPRARANSLPQGWRLAADGP